MRRFDNGFEIHDLAQGEPTAKLAKPGKEVTLYLNVYIYIYYSQDPQNAPIMNDTPTISGWSQTYETHICLPAMLAKPGKEVTQP